MSISRRGWYEPLAGIGRIWGSLVRRIDESAYLRIYAGCAPSVTLAIGLACGLVLVFLTPPMQVPDEPAHLLRIHQLAAGQLVSVPAKTGFGGEVPRSVATLAFSHGHLVKNPRGRTTVDEALRHFAVPLEPTVTKMHVFTGAAVYSPVVYAPQIFATVLGNRLELPPAASFYLARLLNLLTFFVLVTLAVRRMGDSSWLIAIPALLPMSLFQAASVSPDAITNALAFMLLAMVVSSLNVEQLSTATLITFVVVATALALCKPVYALLVLSFAIISARAFGSYHRYLLFLLVVVLVPLFANGLWLGLIKHITTADVVRASGPVSPKAQMAWVLAHPADYTRVFIASIERYWREIGRGIVGRLGWLDLELRGSWLVAYWTVIASAPLVVGLRLRELNVVRRLWIFSLVLGVILLGATAVYVSWERVGSEIIGGFQGRYLIPVLPWAMTATGVAISTKITVRRLGVLALSLVTSVGAAMTVRLVWLRYYS